MDFSAGQYADPTRGPTVCNTYLVLILAVAQDSPRGPVQSIDEKTMQEFSPAGSSGIGGEIFPAQQYALHT